MIEQSVEERIVGIIMRCRAYLGEEATSLGFPSQNIIMKEIMDEMAEAMESAT